MLRSEQMAHLSKSIIVLFLSLILAFLIPAQKISAGAPNKFDAEPMVEGFAPSTKKIPLTEEQCKRHCDGKLAGNSVMGSLFGFSLLSFCVSIISYDICKRDCTNRGTGGGPGGSNLNPPTHLK